MDIYLERLIDSDIEFVLKSKGCVVVEGIKWCGKSTSSKRFAKTVVELQKPNTFKKYMLYSDEGDVALLTGDKPLMFDEWQKIPDLWDYIRAEIDAKDARGMFILTGSVKPQEDKLRHTGIGRMKKIIMRTMSLYESKESSGNVSLNNLFNNIDFISKKDDKSLSDIAYILCRGGWPKAVTEANEKIALQEAKDYLDVLLESDVVALDGVKRNPAWARAILRAYALNISSPAKHQTLQKDMETNNLTLDARTIESYLDAFRKLFVIEDVLAWSPRMRSKAILRTADTRQFVDPSIAAAVLDAHADDLMNDLETFGLLFESLCIRDLRIYAEKINGKVFNYKDSRGLEIDAIVHLDNGKWGAIEIKLGGDQAIETAANHLLKIKESVDLSIMKEPSFLMVLTAIGYSIKRRDGVYVVPIGSLRD
jgi:predicted AAA+ superfamily ATPase